MITCSPFCRIYARFAAISRLMNLYPIHRVLSLLTWRYLNQDVSTSTQKYTEFLYTSCLTVDRIAKSENKPLSQNIYLSLHTHTHMFKFEFS